MAVKTSAKAVVPKLRQEIVGRLFEEIRLLRREMSLLLPQDRLTHYAHPDRVKKSYQNAIKQHPPVSIWK